LGWPIRYCGSHSWLRRMAADLSNFARRKGSVRAKAKRTIQSLFGPTLDPIKTELGSLRCSRHISNNATDVGRVGSRFCAGPAEYAENGPTRSAAWACRAGRVLACPGPCDRGIRRRCLTKCWLDANLFRRPATKVSGPGLRGADIKSKEHLARLCFSTDPPARRERNVTNPGAQSESAGHVRPCNVDGA
jgi:hypothetical protein